MDNHKIRPEIYDAAYTSADVMAVARITEVVLQNWLARGDLNLIRQNPGRGKARQYSAYEVAHICFVKKLVDHAFPLTSTFKITAALQQLWERCPGGHEGWAEEPNFRSWLLISQAQAGAKRQTKASFPLAHSKIVVDDFVAIWAIERIGVVTKKTMRDALDSFEDYPVTVINMALLLRQTLLHLQRRLAETRSI